MTAAAPTLDQFLTAWLADIVKPTTQPATHSFYVTMVRRYISPALGPRHLDGLQTREVQDWLDELARTCQCCERGTDARRQAGQRRCCAAGRCCAGYPGGRTIQAAHGTLRAALNHARKARMVPWNAASCVTLPGTPRPAQAGQRWNAVEASTFLACARADGDPFYAAYLLLLVNGLRRGEVLGLGWPSADLPGARLGIDWQLQRIGSELVRKRLAYRAAGTVLLPGICTAALQARRAEQDAARTEAGSRWQDSDLVFTTRWGTAVEPANLNRSFEARCAAAGVPQIRLRDTRSTCAALLAELDVSPMVVMQVLRNATVPAAMAAAFARVCEEDVRAALERLAGMLAGAQPGAGAAR